MGESRGNDRFFVKIISGLAVFLLAPLFLFAQDTTSTKTPEKKPRKKEKPVLIEIGKNLYFEKANYLNAGGGFGYLFSQSKAAGSLGIGYNFRYKDKFYKAGFQRTDNISFFGTSVIHLNDLHIATGKRFPSRYLHLSYYYGGSLYAFHERLDLEDPVKRGIGLYGEASVYFKPLYDIGVGLTAYANANIHAPVAGIRVEMFFSGAYRGKKER